MKIKEEHHGSVCNSKDWLPMLWAEKQPYKCPQLRSPCASQISRRMGHTCLGTREEGIQPPHGLRPASKASVWKFSLEKHQKGTFQVLW